MDIVKLITPLNLKEEKTRFFASNTYNPILKYEWDNPEVKKWINQENNRYKNLANAILKQDFNEITKLAKEAFQTNLEIETMNYANSILEKKPILPPKVSVNYIKKEFEKAFTFLNLDYQLDISDEHGFNFRPKFDDRKIILSKHADFTYFSVDGEIKHELLHVIRKENGEFNKIEKSSDYLPTEEGLATYFQDYCGEDGGASLFQHAAEYSVTKISCTSSFRKTFDFLCSLGFNTELAWQRGIRHKFGFIDTSKPGDIVKPSMYFYYEQKIKHLPDERKLRLMVGKISINDVDSYSKYSGIIPLEQLVKFYKLNL